MKLDNNIKIGALDHLRGCEIKYEHLEYATFELGKKFEDVYNVFLILDDREQFANHSSRFSRGLVEWLRFGSNGDDLKAVESRKLWLLWYSIGLITMDDR